MHNKQKKNPLFLRKQDKQNQISNKINCLFDNFVTRGHKTCAIYSFVFNSSEQNVASARSLEIIEIGFEIDQKKDQDSACFEIELQVTSGA